MSEHTPADLVAHWRRVLDRKGQWPITADTLRPLVDMAERAIVAEADADHLFVALMLLDPTRRGIDQYDVISGHLVALRARRG